MAALTNLNKLIVGKACKRFQSHLEAVVEANGDFRKKNKSNIQYLKIFLS